MAGGQLGESRVLTGCKVIALAIGLLLILATPCRAEWIKLPLPTGGTLEADLQLPAGTKKAPGVIYLHDGSVRADGYESAAGRGYDVVSFTVALANAGFVALAPVRQTPFESRNGDKVVGDGLVSVLTAAAFLQESDKVDGSRIGIMGFGEGATIALWALTQVPALKAAVLLSPDTLSEGRVRAENLSLRDFLAGDAVKAIRAPVLLTIGAREDRRSRRMTDALADRLIKSYKRFRYLRHYEAGRRWFRQPRAAFMDDVTGFLRARLR